MAFNCCGPNTFDYLECLSTISANIANFEPERCCHCNGDDDEPQLLDVECCPNGLPATMCGIITGATWETPFGSGTYPCLIGEQLEFVFTAPGPFHPNYMWVAQIPQKSCFVWNNQPSLGLVNLGVSFRCQFSGTYEW